MKNFRILVIPLLMFCLLAITLPTTACPSVTTIQKAVNAADQIDVMTQSVVSATETAFSENLISVEQKQLISPKMQTLAKGSAAFKLAALALKTEYGKTEIPPGKLAALNALFSDTVVVPFLDVLKDLKLVRNVTQIVSALGIIRVAVLTISQAFGKTEIVSLVNRKFKESGIPPYS